MKKLRMTIFLLLLTFLTANAQKNERTFAINDNLVDIKFTTQYTLEDLVYVKAKLIIMHIELKYSLLEFNDEGFLKKISASIDYNDGYSASFKSKELQTMDGPGFRRDFIKIPRKKETGKQR